MYKTWQYLPLPSEKTIENLRNLLNTSRSSSILLAQRGLDTFEKAKAFFNPQKAQLHDPMQMVDMPKAVDRLARAITQKEHIRIYGDYDVDGVTSVALLYKALTQLGAHVSYYIPDRYSEGYGISSQGLSKAINDQVDLLVCVDCGTRAIAQVEKANQAHLDTIICDHHEPGEDLPAAYAFVNPKRKDCTYPFSELSGCGIAFKLLTALIQTYPQYTLDLDHYLDLLVLSIAADIVPITGENRVLAHLGLQRINTQPSLSLAALKECMRPQTTLTISDIVFGLAPPINAAGRMQHASQALDLLLANSQEDASRLATQLQHQNELRKAHDQELQAQALDMIASYDQAAFTHVLCQPSWSKGLLGIGAARCIEHHYKPTILLTQQGDQLVGSARSIPTYNIYEALTACAHLLDQYGGHAHAAGLTLPRANLAAFRQALEKHAAKHLSAEHLCPCQLIDLTLDLHELTTSFLHLLQRMKPFGPSNRTPVFATADIHALRHTVYQDKHLKLWLQQGRKGPIWEAIGFNMADKLPIVHTAEPFQIAYKVENQIFQGQKRYQLVLKDLQAIT